MASAFKKVLQVKQEIDDPLVSDNDSAMDLEETETTQKSKVVSLSTN